MWRPAYTLVNEAKTDPGVALDALASALEEYGLAHLAPRWGVAPQVFLPGSDGKVIGGTWGLILLDNADQAGALGYHDLTPEGMPQSLIFVETTLQAGELVSVTASHEFAEMAVDPWINLSAQANDGTMYAYEVCDAVEESSFPATNGVPLSNFVFPTWFQPFLSPGATQFDFLKTVSSPFELASGGYAPVWANGQWSQIFGSEEKRGRFAKEDRRLHRSELRAPIGTPRKLVLSTR